MVRAVSSRTRRIPGRNDSRTHGGSGSHGSGPRGFHYCNDGVLDVRTGINDDGLAHREVRDAGLLDGWRYSRSRLVHERDSGLQCDRGIEYGQTTSILVRPMRSS